MTKTENVLQQFIADHEGVIDAALRAYIADMRELGSKESLLPFAQAFDESADKAQEALDAFEKLAEAVEQL